MDDRRRIVRLVAWLCVWSVVAVLARLLSGEMARIPGMTVSGPMLVGLIAVMLAGSELIQLLCHWFLARQRKPVAEGVMLGRIVNLVAGLVILLMVVWSFGRLDTVGQGFALFGGMILGWSLQAPVSGFAAWILVSLKRPFRPGDRIQFPNLGLTGDVHDIGPMYTVLDQVGGTIASEEAVGRYILVPNPLLFSQVVINYTVVQESPFMLDEILIRITYDSDWDAAERILLEAARAVTSDIIATTGVQPYIRSEWYDYGVYLRLRYQCRVKDRAGIQYEMYKRVFVALKGQTDVDLAIPYVYSYRAGLDQKAAGPKEKEGREAREIRDVEVGLIHNPHPPEDPHAVDELAHSIAERGLLQPIILVRAPTGGLYEIVAGNNRYEACRSLGWNTVPAIVNETTPATPA
jgi:small-conductance mechanosensitive channel